MFNNKFKIIASLIAIIVVITSFTVTSDASSFDKGGKSKSHYVIDGGAFKELETYFYDCFVDWNITIPKRYEESKQKENEHKPKHESVEQNNESVQKEQVTPELTDKVDTEQKDKGEQQNTLLPFEHEVIQLTNEERAKNGLAPLQIEEALSKVARDKSKDMQMNNYFDHHSPVYGSPFDMMRSYGIQYTSAGENIAKGQRTPEEVVNAWMNSPGHRANILNSDYTHIGVGYVEQGNYWTQQFIRK